MVQMISESKRKIAALALAGAMAIGGAAGVATTIASPAQNQSGIVMEAEAATDYDLAHPKFGSYYTKKDSGAYWIWIDVTNGYNYNSGIPNRKFKVFIDGKELTSTSTKVTTDDYTLHGYTRSNGWYITGDSRRIKGWFKVGGAKGTTHRIVFKFANGSSRGISFTNKDIWW